jgi:hypothetical protein
MGRKGLVRSMANAEYIQTQQTLLATHRSTLNHYLLQLAQHGTAYAPPAVVHGITAERAAIHTIKHWLRAQGEHVDDYPNDGDAAEAHMHRGQAAGVSFTNADVEIAGQLNQAGKDIVQGGTGTGTPAPATPAPDVQFENKGVKVGGTSNQAGGSIYINSAHTAGGGSAFVTNNPPPPWARPPAAEPQDAAQISPLSLSFEPTSAGVRLRWQSDPLGLRESSFVSPYQGDDLALMLRALDALQYPDDTPPAHSFSIAEQQRLIALTLWDSANGRLRRDAHQQVGRALYTALTADPAGAQAMGTARDYATASGQVLQLVLRFPPAAIRLAALPWELLWDAEPTPLLFRRSPHASCTRHLDLPQALPPARQRSEPLRILAIAPQAGIDAQTRQEERAVRQRAWQLLIDEKLIQVQEVSPATRAALSDAVQRFHPHVIHYYGHGRYRNGMGALLLDGADGGYAWTDTPRLMTLFGGVRLVALFACQGAMLNATASQDLLTGIAPALSATGVPYVLGMQLTTRISAATRASEIIYRSLAQNQSIQAAVSNARQALFVEEDDQASWYLPALYICSREIGPAYL